MSGIANSLGVIGVDGPPTGDPYRSAHAEPVGAPIVQNGGLTRRPADPKNPNMQPGGQGTLSSAQRSAQNPAPHRYRSTFAVTTVQEYATTPDSSGLHQVIGRQYPGEQLGPQQPWHQDLRLDRSLPDAAWDSGLVIAEDYGAASFALGGV